ncbi:MAG TPA: outer membrane beta-barrel protein, partial [Bacteroidota bacterium]
MKRHAVLLLLVFAASSACRAQMIRGWGVEGGAVGGYQLLTITSATSSPVIPRAIRWGFSAGAFVEFLNMPTLSLVLESAYAQEGRKVTAEEIAEVPHQPTGLSPGPAGSTPRLDYVHLAMLVKLRAGKVGFVPYAAVGPKFDFLVGKADDPAHVFDNFKKSDVGVVIAAGIEIVPRRQPLISL